MHIAACAEGLGLRRFVHVADARLLSQTCHFLGNFRIGHGMSVGVDNAILKADLSRTHIEFFSHRRGDLIAQSLRGITGSIACDIGLA